MFTPFIYYIDSLNYIYFANNIVLLYYYIIIYYIKYPSFLFIINLKNNPHKNGYSRNIINLDSLIAIIVWSHKIFSKFGQYIIFLKRISKHYSMYWYPYLLLKIIYRIHGNYR